MSGLADRIRGIIHAPGPKGPGLQSPAVGRVLVDPPTAPDIESVLGGEWRETGGARCFVVERRMAPDARHGRDDVGTLADWMAQGTDRVVCALRRLCPAPVGISRPSFA